MSVSGSLALPPGLFTLPDGVLSSRVLLLPEPNPGMPPDSKKSIVPKRETPNTYLCQPLGGEHKAAWMARGNVEIWGSVGQGDGQSAGSRWTGVPSRRRSSRLAWGPVTANLAPAWSTAVTVPCTLTTAPVSLAVAQRRHPGACGQAAGVLRVVEGEAGPVLGDLGDLIEVADGVRVWRRSHLGPDAGGVPGLLHEPLGPAGAYLRVPAEPGSSRAGHCFHNLVFVGVGVGGVLLSDGATPSSALPGPSRDWEARGCPGRGPGPVPGWTSSGREWSP